MIFIANSINNIFLEEILPNEDGAKKIKEVKMAVAYANGNEQRIPKILVFCDKHKIPLKFWCRYGDGVASFILKLFLNKTEHSCKGIKNFHAKIIWLVGHGVYIGSANLTDNGWRNNIEAGLFFSDDDIVKFNLYSQLNDFFEKIDEISCPFTEDIVEKIELLESEQKSSNTKKEDTQSAIIESLNEYYTNYMNEHGHAGSKATETRKILDKKSCITPEGQQQNEGTPYRANLKRGELANIVRKVIEEAKKNNIGSVSKQDFFNAIPDEVKMRAKDSWPTHYWQAVEREAERRKYKMNNDRLILR